MIFSYMCAQRNLIPSYCACSNEYITQFIMMLCMSWLSR